MFDLAKKYSGIRDFNQLNLIEADAEDYIQNCKETFDIVFIDLFIESEIPDFCFTEPFVANIQKALSKKGLVIWNMLTKNKFDCKKIQELAKVLSFENIEKQNVAADNVVVYFVKG